MVCDGRQSTQSMRTCFGNDDLISVGVDHKVSVVGDHDHLTALLGFDEERHQFIIHRLWIKVLFGLVDEAG